MKERLKNLLSRITLLISIVVFIIFFAQTPTAFSQNTHTGSQYTTAQHINKELPVFNAYPVMKTPVRPA